MFLGLKGEVTVAMIASKNNEIDTKLHRFAIRLAPKVLRKDPYVIPAAQLVVEFVLLYL
jgi:hypothetical protein